MKNIGRKLTEKEILVIADELEGITFKELDYSLAMNKGSFGLAIEEKAFGILANSDSNPDFNEAGIELKVTPYKMNKNKSLSAKERLVLNIINYEKENLDSFKLSSFWKKNEKLLILFYLFEEHKAKEDLMITKSLMHEFNSQDLEIIKNDWEIIKEKILKGLAHEISEADTMYLGACTKGVNHKSTRKQPFSDIRAKQRAYSLKTTYMTQLVRKHICKIDNEKIFDEAIEMDFESAIRNKLKKYFGKTQSELMKHFGFTNKPKQINELLLGRMLNLKGKISSSDEFLKANIVPKTVRVEQSGRIKESMSFPAFKYVDIVKQNWDGSDFKEMFETTKYLFIIFKKIDNEYVFDNVMLWNMPEEVLEHQVKDVWEKTVELIKSGNIISKIAKGKKYTTFPGSRFNGIAHVRPHGRNANDTNILPVSDIKFGFDKHTKHCFWLNSGYIKKIIDNLVGK